MLLPLLLLLPIPACFGVRYKDNVEMSQATSLITSLGKVDPDPDPTGPRFTCADAWEAGPLREARTWKEEETMQGIRIQNMRWTRVFAYSVRVQLAVLSMSVLGATCGFDNNTRMACLFAWFDFFFFFSDRGPIMQCECNAYRPQRTVAKTRCGTTP